MLASSFEPGTNLKGEAGGAHWSFVLDDLDVHRALVLGRPPEASLRSLARLCREVAVAPGRPGRKSAGHGDSSANVRIIDAVTPARLSLPDASVDLLFFCDPSVLRRAAEQPSDLENLRRILRAGGTVYFEMPWWSPSLDHGARDRLESAFGPIQALNLTPGLGREAHTVVPTNDHETNLFFDRSDLQASVLPGRVGRKLDRWVRLVPGSGRVGRRSGYLCAGQGKARSGPPRYLVDLARKAGVSLEGFRWGLSAPGSYASKKVLFFLFDRPGSPPCYVVKMTRSSNLNHRLENEHRALKLLEEKGIGVDGELPRSRFFGHDGGLAVLGETVVHGKPFREMTAAHPQCPHVLRTIDWLTQLAVRTVDLSAASCSDAAQDLATLLKRYVEIYRPQDHHRRALERQLESLAAANERFPAVFQHGDPGTWNILIDPSGRAGFLDWESADPRGMPLWDLLYFLRSFCVEAGRRTGNRDALAAFADSFLLRSKLQSFVTSALAHYCSAISLPASLLEPIFYSCWMHRSLKEATRLKKGALPSGHYTRLLGLCLDHARESESLLAGVARVQSCPTDRR